MFVRLEDNLRTDGGFVGERDTPLGYLRDQRLTLELKCAGLDAVQLARRAVEPSTLSLLRLVRRLADTERAWFRIRMAGQPVDWLYRTPENREADFDDAVADPAVVTAPTLHRPDAPAVLRPRRPARVLHPPASRPPGLPASQWPQPKLHCASRAKRGH